METESYNCIHTKAKMRIPCGQFLINERSVRRKVRQRREQRHQMHDQAESVMKNVSILSSSRN